MDGIEILDLYRRYDPKTAKNFVKNVDSSLVVKTNLNESLNDFEWIDMIESHLKYIDRIFNKAGKLIIDEEEIVQLEKVKRVTVESVKHLAKHTNLIDDVEENGDVRPAKLLNINKEESIDTYENRLIYTLVQNITTFITMKKAMLEDLSKKNKEIEYTGNTVFAGEKLKVEIRLTSDSKKRLSLDDPKHPMYIKVKILEKKVNDLKKNHVYKYFERKRAPLVRPPIKKTNMVLKNVNFQYAMKLWDFLQQQTENAFTHENSQEVYEENDELKKFLDETFMLQYMSAAANDKGNKTPFSPKEQEKYKEKIVEKIVKVNGGELTREQMIKIAEQYAYMVRYKNAIAKKSIWHAISEDIENYFTQVKRVKL